MRVMILLVAAVSLQPLGGCTGSAVAPPSSQPPVATMPATAATAPAVSRDQAVIEAVLADLLALSESPLDVRDAPPAEIRFMNEPVRSPVTVKRILARNEKEKWAALSEEQVHAATEAAAQIVQRQEEGEGFEPFRPRDPRIMTDLSPATTRGLRVNRPVRAWPPGFTADGKHAVVFLTIPWSIHSADATYLLARDGEKWHVLLRQFVYYF